MPWSLGNCFVWLCLATAGIVGVIGFSPVESQLPEAWKGSCNGTGLEHYTHEKRLLSCLLRDYDPFVRPSLSPNQSVIVTLDSVIFTINSLSERRGVLTTDSWLKQSWVDVQLKWNPVDFGGVDEIRLPVEKLWTPEIVLINNADDSFRYVMDKLAVVNSSGQVTWIPHARLHSFCELDLTLFPYDTQTCQLFLGSWTYDQSLVSIRIQGGRRFLPKTTDWEVMDFNADVVPVVDGLKRYPTAVYTIRLRRVSVFYRYMLVAPSVILACLTLLLYWIPPESHERFMLATGILVSLSVLHILLEGYLPTELGKLPIIASYLGFNLVLLVITIIISVVTMNCRYRSIQGQTVPSWIRWVFLGRLSRLMCIKVRRYAEPVAFTVEQPTKTDFAGEFRDLLSHPSSSSQNEAPQGAGSQTNLEKTMEDIRRYLHQLANTTENTIGGHRVTPHSELVENEWVQLAMVIDRLMFFVFLFISLITTIVIYGHS